MFDQFIKMSSIFVFGKLKYLPNSNQVSIDCGVSKVKLSRLLLSLMLTKPRQLKALPPLDLKLYVTCRVSFRIHLEVPSGMSNEKSFNSKIAPKKVYVRSPNGFFLCVFARLSNFISFRPDDTENLPIHGERCQQTLDSH